MVLIGRCKRAWQRLSCWLVQAVLSIPSLGLTSGALGHDVCSPTGFVFLAHHAGSLFVWLSLTHPPLFLPLSPSITHSLSLSLPYTHTFSLPLSLSLSLFFSLSLSLIHSHTHTLALSLSHPLSLSLFHSPTHSLTHTLTHSLSPPLSLSHTHTCVEPQTHIWPAERRGHEGTRDAVEKNAHA